MWTGQIRAAGEGNLVIAFGPPHFRNASAIAANMFIAVSKVFKKFSG